MQGNAWRLTYVTNVFVRKCRRVLEDLSLERADNIRPGFFFSLCMHKLLHMLCNLNMHCWYYFPCNTPDVKLLWKAVVSDISVLHCSINPVSFQAIFSRWGWRCFCLECYSSVIRSGCRNETSCLEPIARACRWSFATIDGPINLWKKNQWRFENLTFYLSWLGEILAWDQKCTINHK